MEASQIGDERARERTAVVLISDRPEHFRALRHSALSGRAVYLWLRNGARPPAWAIALRGAPTNPETFAPLAGRDAIVVVDLADESRAREVAGAAGHALPMPALLLVEREVGHHHESTRGVTWIAESELLADAIEAVLRRVADRRRVAALRRALHGADRCAFLVQNDPDPDAIASALALRAALGLGARQAPIVTCGEVARPENVRLVDALGIVVRHIETEDIAALGPLVLVDVQPPYFKGALLAVAAVIDHHPTSGSYRAGYRDVRTSFGASATMAAGYLLAARPEALTRPLATALLYGIITDTKSLSRAASDEDLEMFAFLFPRADHAMLRRIQHPSYGPLALRRFGAALQRARVRHGLAYLHLGRLPATQEHVVAQFAEFCLGMAGASIAAVSGQFGSRLIMSTRALSNDAALGDRLRAAFGGFGSAGGHPTMAKAVVKLAAWRRDHPFETEEELAETIRRALRAALRAPDERRVARTRERRSHAAARSVPGARGNGRR